MRTLTLQEPGRIALSDTAAPSATDLAPGEALIRIHRVGICGTDLHAFRGRQPFFSYPRILGHELGVEVVAVGAAVENVSVGGRCAVEPYLNCGVCIACRRDRPNCCTKLQCLGVHTDGGMRDLLVVPARKLHPSKTLTLEQLALVETLGIGAHAVQRAVPGADETLLVVGAGPIGLSVVTFVRAAGARVIVRDLNEDRLRFCREQFGVADTLSTPDADSTLAALSDLTNGDLPTVVFDATGNAASMMESFRYVAQGGRLVFVGLFVGDVTFHDPEFHRREMTLLASRNSTPGDFRRILGLMESGRIDTTPWITHRIPAEGLPDAFAGLLDPECGVLKSVVEF
jgi:2-desacetyl-2-hydroxyethyl bacteriochlorophyllide A dehydrogenase